MKTYPFVGRLDVVEKLGRLFRRKVANLVVIRGRRRIGKSRLAQEFGKETEKFYQFTGLAPARGTTAQSQREEFARQLQEQIGMPGLKADDWGDLFTILAKQIAGNRVVVLLDEISWMGSKDPSFLSKLKVVWDIHFKNNPHLILILCGSVSTWIEENIISSTGFFGRINLKILLKPLSLTSCGQLLDEIGFRGSDFEKLMILCVTGGVPWYLELLDPGLSAIENIRQLCFEKDAILSDEFDRIFHDLFERRSEICKAIVKQLSQGPLEHSEIAKALEYSSGGVLSDYLNELVQSGFLSRDHTWSIKTEKRSSLARYRLSDNYLRFYVRCVEPNKERILRGSFDAQSISSQPSWDSIMGLQFENLVLENRHLVQKKLRIQPSDIVYDNPFFQRKTAKQMGCQVDYLIQTRYRTLYLCEVKFSKRPVSKSVISDVQEKIERLKIPKGYSVVPILIHVGGVSDKVLEENFFLETIDFTELIDRNS